MKTRQLWISAAAIAVFATLPLIQNAGAWGRFRGGVHPDFHPHHYAPPPPHGGCVGCGIGAAAVAGLIGGVVIGAAISGSGAVPAPPPVMAPAPVIVQPTYVATPGMAVAGLPPGCAAMDVNGVQYYQCGPTWYQPLMGGNGVYYAVVPAP